MSQPPPHGPRPFTGWQWVWRGVFGADVAGHRYDVEVDYFDIDEKIWLYRDGELWDHRVKKGSWDVGDGARLIVELQLFGMRRAQIRHCDGSVTKLDPAPGGGEHWRAEMHRRYPTASRVASALSLAILTVSLVLAVPEWVSLALGVAGIEWEWLGLSPGTTTAMSVLAVVAGVERALRLRRESFT